MCPERVNALQFLCSRQAGHIRANRVSWNYSCHALIQAPSAFTKLIAPVVSSGASLA
jgi:hypothetical protein